MQTLYGSGTAWRTLIDPNKSMDSKRHNQVDAGGDTIWLELTNGKVVPALLPSEFDYTHLEFLQEHINPNIEFNDLCELVDENGEIVDGVNDYVTTALLDAFPAAMETMELILSFHEADSLVHEWTMPSGFKVRSNVRTTTLDIISLDLGLDSNVEVAISSKVLGENEFSKALSPDIIHSLDAEVIDKVSAHFDKLAVPMMAIHDDVGVPAAFADELRKVYREFMIELLEGNPLEDILTQLDTCPKGFKYNKKRTLTAEHIMQSEFILS